MVLVLILRLAVAMVIDTSDWGEFCVGKLFNCETTLGIPSKNNLKEGNINYITRSAIDNGFSGTCGNEEHKNKGNCITIGAEGFVAFWQNDDFVAGNKVYALRHPKMNETNGLFICSALNVLSSRYSFSDARILDKIKLEKIKLPATPDGEPDWQYMESYMKKIMQESEQSIENLNRVEDKKDLIDVSGWGKMCIGDYFNVEYGTYRPKDKLGIGDYNYVTTSGFNNGITDRIDIADHQGNCITVASDGALMGSAFYQKEPFSTSNIVSTLTPFDTTPLNKYNAQFICTLIFNKRSEFGWLGFKFSVDRVRNLIINVPVTSTGEPDWKYMENYMKKIMEESEQTISELQVVASDNHVIEEKSETIKKEDCLDKDKAILEEFLQFCNRK